MTGDGRGADDKRSSIEELDEETCLALISSGGVGRIAYSGRFGQVVIPVNYRLYQQTIVLRTTLGGSLDEDLRTRIAHAEYKVAFEIDDIDLEARAGWSVLIQGSAHHVDSPEERASVMKAGLEVWPDGARDLFLRILPTRITGRRIHSRGTDGDSGDQS